MDNFSRSNGNFFGVNNVSFIDENFKVCPICHSKEPIWHMNYKFNDLGTKDFYNNSLCFIRCSKCNAIYKYKFIDILKFTDQNVLKFSIENNIDLGSMNVNDIKLEIINPGTKYNSLDLIGTKITVRVMNSDSLFIKESHQNIIETTNETIIEVGNDQRLCPQCGTQLYANAKFCTHCRYEIPSNEKEVCCPTCGGLYDENGECSNCINNLKDQDILSEKETPGLPLSSSQTDLSNDNTLDDDTNDKKTLKGFSLFGLLSLILSQYSLSFGIITLFKSTNVLVFNEIFIGNSLIYFFITIILCIVTLILETKVNENEVVLIWKIFKVISLVTIIISFLLIVVSIFSMPVENINL